MLDVLKPEAPPASADCSITKFLNRILGLEVHKQNALFQYFSDTFDHLIEMDKKEGKYDMGILGECHQGGGPNGTDSWYPTVQALTKNTKGQGPPASKTLFIKSGEVSLLTPT